MTFYTIGYLCWVLAKFFFLIIFCKMLRPSSSDFLLFFTTLLEDTQFQVLVE